MQWTGTGDAAFAWNANSAAKSFVGRRRRRCRYRPRTLAWAGSGPKRSHSLARSLARTSTEWAHLHNWPSNTVALPLKRIRSKRADSAELAAALQATQISYLGRIQVVISVSRKRLNRPQLHTTVAIRPIVCEPVRRIFNCLRRGRQLKRTPNGARNESTIGSERIGSSISWID